MKCLVIIAFLASVGLSLAFPADAPENADLKVNEDAPKVLNDTKNEETSSPVTSDDYIYETPSTMATPIKDEQIVDGDGETPKAENLDDIQDPFKVPKPELVINPLEILTPPIDLIDSFKDLMEKEIAENTGGKKNLDEDLNTILKDMSQDEDISQMVGKPAFPIFPPNSHIMLRIFNRPLVSKVFDKRMPIHVVINPFLMFMPQNKPAEYRAGAGLPVLG